MHISYTGIVNRRSAENGKLRYGFTTWSLHAISSWPEHTDAIREIEQAECHFSVSQYDLSDKFRSADVEEMLVGVPEAERTGCVLIWAYPSLTSGFSVGVMIGAGCSFPSELEESLHSEHLGVEATFEIPFSLLEENERVRRPVTYSQFRDGRRILMPNNLQFSLVRRHVP